LNVDFLLFKIFEQLALALKNRVALEFFAVLKYIFLFRIFEELAVALKTEFALKIFKPGWRPPLRFVRLWILAIQADKISVTYEKTRRHYFGRRQNAKEK